MKYFLDPPPKKRRRGMNGRDMAPITCVCLYQKPVTWSFTRSRLSDSAQSNPFIQNYLIIVAFSGPHFSIYDIFYTKESTLSFTLNVRIIILCCFKNDKTPDDKHKHKGPFIQKAGGRQAP